MGVPKFFRWVAERFPTVITPFRDSPPPVDNLYLDMNGIIHNCTHTNDLDATQKSATEKAMVEAMFAYLEKLFNAIQPRKYFFLAVDGVAPRAKMNQQRQRRYRSGYDMMVAREEALARGDDVPDEGDVFDSNCITPGTNFMVMVSEQFQYFITMKIASDPAWQNCKVVYSGHDNPGEGEHKIVDFIRRRKMQPGYSSNETHCMYGLDADLVMLALATHEPHFILLREVVSFGSGQESRRAREKREEDEANGIIADKSYHKADEFVLFHVNVLRDYLDLDVRDKLGQSLPADYCLERVLDDFVLMCFFIGNDFLPSIPTLGIHDGSLLQMIDLYCNLILVKGMYLTNKGQINWRAVEIWLQAIGELELTTIKAREQQEEEYRRRMSRHDSTHEVASITRMPVESLQEYKNHFYREKHGFENGWDPQGKDMAELSLHYIEGLMWVMGYYYQGPPSWKWFFPHHYAPMASDLVNLPAIAAKVRFDPGKPFLPHQQLLAVLPPMSYRSMPRAYWPLLLSDKSPLKRFFPDSLQIDRDGARAPWEGIVLIPFIEESVLIASYESVQSKLGPEDKKHNTLGPATLFSFDAGMDPCDVPNTMFGPLHNVRVRRQPFEFPFITRFVPELCPGVAIGSKQLEGFATLRSKWNYIQLQRETGVVTIFGMPTRKESVLLGLKDSMNYLGAMEASSLVGQEVLVGFPHYRRARVASISNKVMSIRAVMTPDGTFCGTETKDLNRDESLNFTKECETHMQYMKEKLGIVVKDIPLLLYVNVFNGMRLTRKGRIVRNFSRDEVCYASQLVAHLKDVDMIEDSRCVERDRVEGDVRFGSKAVFIGTEPKNKKLPTQTYGSVGVVYETGSSSGSSGGGDTCDVVLRVHLEPLSIPSSLISFAKQSNWMALHEVANEFRIGALALRLLVGSLRTSPQYGSREVGLGLIFIRNHLARVGYTKLVSRHTNAWTPYTEDVFTRLAQNAEPAAHYLDNANKGDFLGRSSHALQYTTWFSREAVSLIRRYVEEFQPLVKQLENGSVAPQALDPPQFMTGKWQELEVDDVLTEMENFIMESGIRDVPLVSASDDTFTREHLRELEEELDRQSPRPVRDLILRGVVRRHLYFPITYSSGGHITQLPLPQEQKFRLGARVVNCRPVGSVPFGATGTIVRLLASSHDAEVVYDEPFTGGSHFDGRLRQSRGGLSKLSSLLVLREQPGTGGEPMNESDNVTAVMLKNLLQKSQQQQQQEQKSPMHMTESVLTIPKPRSAVEDTSATTTVSGATASLAGVTISGGAGGIRLADLVGKLNASPQQSILKSKTTPTTLLEDQKGSRASPASIKPVDTTTTTTTSTNKTGSVGNRRSGEENNNNTRTASTPPKLEVNSAMRAQGKSDDSATLGNLPSSRRKEMCDNAKPNTIFTIPREIVNGNFTIRHGEAVPFFRRLMKMRIAEELNKTS